MTTTEAARALGMALTILTREGTCEFTDAMTALLAATPHGDTPERSAALDAFSPPQRE